MLKALGKPAAPLTVGYGLLLLAILAAAFSEEEWVAAPVVFAFLSFLGGTVWLAICGRHPTLFGWGLGEILCALSLPFVLEFFGLQPNVHGWTFIFVPVGLLILFSGVVLTIVGIVKFLRRKRPANSTR